MNNKNLVFVITSVLILSSFMIPINDVFANDGSSIVQVDSLEHEAVTESVFNSLVQVDADTLALAYRAEDADGFISTFDIAADGTITEVDTLEHDTNLSQYNSLVQVDADTYALAYSGGGNDGFISTFDIAADGTITAVTTQSLGNNLEHDTVLAEDNSLVQVDADTYALAYSGESSDGYISTFTISNTGVVTAVTTQSLGNNLEHDTVFAADNSLVQVDADTYALAYRGDGFDGFISTFTISNTGVVTAVRTQSLGNNLEHDTDRGSGNSMVQVDADTYALAYTSDGNDGFISTFDIAADGSSITEVDTLEHDDVIFAQDNSLVQVDADTYALAYNFSGGGADSGFISTFDIAADGTITAVKTRSLGNNLEHDTGRSVHHSMVQVDADTYALAYTSDGNDGFIKTFTISTAATAEDSTQKKSSSDCYDCKPPVLQSSHITILTNDYVVATGDDPIHITANVGDKVTVILNVTDNKSVDTIPFAALYTNYQEKPSDMSAFYANNFDKWKHVSTSFYEWNVRADDVPYDYDGTVSWSDNAPTVVTDVTTADNFKFKNDDNNMVEYFMVPFTFTINDFMEESAITAKIYDASGNRLHVTLPVTLKVAGNDPLNFDYTGKQKVLGFYDESVLSEMVETWSESESDTKQMSSLLGISDESLPPWTSNLATWVAEGTIDSSDLKVAVEYLINQ